MPLKAKVVMRQKRVIGDIVKIDLGDGMHTYARVLREATAFYDARSDHDLPVEEILRKRVLFIIVVMEYAITRGRWVRVGNAPLEPALISTPPMFIQARHDPSQLQIYENGRMRPATREECEGLEACAAWDPEHVEERLRDHYAGRPNKWFESLRIR